MELVLNKLQSQGPHSQILMIGWGGGGGGGPTEVHILYPKKSLPFLAYPKKSLSPFFATQKIPLFFFATKKNPGVFHRPKKKTFGQNFRPKKSLRPPPPPSLKYVSQAPGATVYSSTELSVYKHNTISYILGKHILYKYVC